MDRRRKIIVILGVTAAVFITALVLVSCLGRAADPNKVIRKLAKEMVEGEEYGGDFKRSPDWMGEAACMTVYSFTPEESAEYTFTAKGTALSDNVEMEFYVVDEAMSELIKGDNYGGDEEAPAQSDSMEGTGFLTKGQKYYVVVEAFSEDSSGLESFKDSFRISVAKAGDGAPEEIKAGGKVRLRLNKDQQACAVFIPEESAFYDFDTEIVSKDAATGFSSIYSIADEDGTAPVVTDGICPMEAGRTYYIWVGVDETTKKSSEVELSCTMMASETAEGICTIEVSGKTVIEYTADANAPLMISSSSDGDPKVVMYDSEGFLLREDDNSGAAVSDNPLEFALGFNAERNKVYRICVDGDFTQCKVIIQVYKGDGTSPDSVDDAENGEDAGAAGDETETDIGE